MLQLEAIQVDLSNIAAQPMEFVGNQSTDSSISFDRTLARILEPEVRSDTYDTYDISMTPYADSPYENEASGTQAFHAGGSDEYGAATSDGARSDSEYTGVASDEPKYAVSKNDIEGNETLRGSETRSDLSAESTASGKDVSAGTQKSRNSKHQTSTAAHENLLVKQMIARGEAGVKKAYRASVKSDGAPQTSDAAGEQVLGRVATYADGRKAARANGKVVVNANANMAAGNGVEKDGTTEKDKSLGRLNAFENETIIGANGSNAIASPGMESVDPTEELAEVLTSGRALDAEPAGGDVAREATIRSRTVAENSSIPDSTKATGKAGSGNGEYALYRLASEAEASTASAQNQATGTNDSKSRNPGSADAPQAKTTVIDLRESTTAENRTENARGENLFETAESRSGISEDGLSFREFRTSGMTGFRGSEQFRADGASSFSRAFRDTMNPEIVKQSTIVLKNNQQGEIRLNLKPEHLGNVRVRLEIVENRITGRIIVDNALVRETVEQNLEDLARAFREQGYESAALDVSVSGQSDRRAGGDENENSPAARRAIQEIEDTVPSAMEAEYHGIVNVVV